MSEIHQPNDGQENNRRMNQASSSGGSSNNASNGTSNSGSNGTTPSQNGANLDLFQRLFGSNDFEQDLEQKLDNGMVDAQENLLDDAAVGMGQIYAQIVGWGSYVPEKVIKNQDLEQIVDTSDDWIRARTGIEERRVVVDPHETTGVMAIKASREALAVADVPASKIDLIICATSSPEHIFPSTASIVQDSLGAVNAGAYDLSAACSGFVYALSTARGHILAGDAEYVLVIGSETMSRLVDWTDRNTCVLFGDGAGALLLAASDVPGGVTAVDLGSDGSGANSLIIPAGGSAMPANLETVSTGSHFIRMDGRAVFRFATRTIASSTRKVLAKSGLSIDDVDMVIPHQANLRIIHNSVQKQLKIPKEKIFANVQKYGNTSAASIPIALCEAISEGKIKPDDNLVLVGFGGGLTWAACTVKWCVPVDETRSSNWWTNTRHAAEYRAAAARSMIRRAVRWISGSIAVELQERSLKNANRTSHESNEMTRQEDPVSKDE
ncbi:MAG: beta-ketoacyl-ACP synthase III [Chloroflexota bacterium]